MSVYPRISGIIVERGILVFGRVRRAEEGPYRTCSHEQGILFQVGIAHGGARIAVAQQTLDFVERVPGIDKNAGKGMAQVMDAHIAQPQLPPQVIPEQIQVRKRASRGMSGKEPGAARTARQFSDDGDGLVGKSDVARLVGFGEGDGQTTLLQPDIFPFGPQNFAFARTGEKEQLQGPCLLPRGAVQRLHEAVRFVGCQMPFAQLQDAEGVDTGTRREEQNVMRDSKRAQALEDAENTIAGRRSKALSCQGMKPDFHGRALNRFERTVAERGQDMLPQDAFINFPASLAQADMWQIGGGNKGGAAGTHCLFACFSAGRLLSGAGRRSGKGRGPGAGICHDVSPVKKDEDCSKTDAVV